ncbi:MAG: hypothetical protein ACI8TX_001626 [Hyphomicrobiaceae bacterium]|jgi:hypothetical protein
MSRYQNTLQSQPAGGFRHSRSDKRDILIAALLWAALLGWLLSWHPFQRALLLDAATWDSLSVGLAHGEIPYRDVFLHKTPGAAMLGALGVWVAEAFDKPGVFGAHAVFLALGAAGPALLYLVCRVRLGVAAALTAALWFAAADVWTVAALEGVRPKIATVVFGLGSLLAAGHARAAWAGIFATASALCWQPGLVFGVGAVLELTFANSHPRRGQWFRFGFAASLVVAAFLIWLSIQGALSAFFADAIVFNREYVSTGLKPVAATASRLWSILERLALPEVMIAMLAFPAIVLRRPAVPPGLALAGGLYLAIVFTSFQGWPDTLLLMPTIAMLLAVGTNAILESVWPRRTVAIVCLLLAAWTVATPDWSRIRTPITYQEQSTTIASLMRRIPADQPIVAIGAPEILLHSERGRDWPWPYFWFGVDRFAADQSGGFKAMLDELEALNPAMIVIARRWQGRYHDDFEVWAKQRYERSTFRVFPHTKSPCQVWLRRNSMTGL